MINLWIKLDFKDFFILQFGYASIAEKTLSNNVVPFSTNAQKKDSWSFPHISTLTLHPQDNPKTLSCPILS
jgi:hypothetical protein